MKHGLMVKSSYFVRGVTYCIKSLTSYQASFSGKYSAISSL